MVNHDLYGRNICGMKTFMRLLIRIHLIRVHRLHPVASILAPVAQLHIQSSSWPDVWRCPVVAQVGTAVR